jgi:hypothetical protein
MANASEPAALRESASQYRKAQLALCARVRDLAKARGTSPEAAAYLIFKDRQTLNRVEEGGEITTSIFNAALKRLVARETEIARKQMAAT